MRLKDIKEKFKEFAKRAINATVMGATIFSSAVGLTLISSEAIWLGRLESTGKPVKEVMINDPACVKAVDTLEDAHSYLEDLAEAKASGDTKEVKEIQEVLKKLADELSEHGKYDKMEVYVARNGECQIKKWAGDKAYITHDAKRGGEVVAYYEIDLKDGQYNEKDRNIKEEYHLNTGTTLADKIMRAAKNILNGKNPFHNQTTKVSLRGLKP